jgi:hypothetical protein
MPVPDQVQNDGSAIKNILKPLDSAKASLRARVKPGMTKTAVCEVLSITTQSDSPE